MGPATGGTRVRPYQVSPQQQPGCPKKNQTKVKQKHEIFEFVWVEVLCISIGTFVCWELRREEGVLLKVFYEAGW